MDGLGQRFESEGSGGWSARQYTKFEAERTRPVRDLLAQLPKDGVRTAVDLGCGPGNSTSRLRSRYPSADIVGIDLSPDMIEAARRRLPDVRFEIGDIGAWDASGPFDLILANASLQWVPDHASLLYMLIGKLGLDGRLAVQVPDNLGEPSHRLMVEVAADGPWAEKLAGVAPSLPPRHDAAWYYRTLRELVSGVDVWRTTYYHPLAGSAAAIVEWFKGTALLPFLTALDENEQRAFLARYEAALADAYPALADGTVLLPFPRVFFVATR